MQKSDVIVARRTFLHGLTLLSFGLGAFGSARAQTLSRDIGYLGTALDALSRARLMGPDADVETLLSAATMGCQAIGMLQKEPELAERLDTILKEGGDPSKIIAELDEFTRFLALERNALVNAGLSSGVADALIQTASTFSAANAARFESASDVMSELARVENVVCFAAGRMRDAQNDEENWAYLYQIGKGVGGAAIIGVNAFAELPSLGLASASLAIGGAMLGSVL